jgi:2-dehydro-3-deoxyphosphogluconate aldolase/(4S)-4-hydroxy-2-oxoglutarate aldolase
MHTHPLGHPDIDVLASVEAVRLVPVIVVDDADSASRLGAALLAGGLPLAEVTFRTPRAEDALRAMAADPNLCVGAGTVVTVDQCERALAAGARFVVTPGLRPAVIQHCLEASVPVFPGVATATETLQAIDLGTTVVKFFPAEATGGMHAIAALAGPLPQVRFIPTGGITETNLSSYLAHPAVTAVGGSWMAPASLIRAGEWEQIIRLTRRAVTAARHAKEPR